MPSKSRSVCSCGHRFPEGSRLRKCPVCGLARVRKRRSKHFDALKLPRSAYVEANGGYDGCWVCRDLGVDQTGKKLQRDHAHVKGEGAGLPRGILCAHHNRLLGPRYTPRLVASYARYLARPNSVSVVDSGQANQRGEVS